MKDRCGNPRCKDFPNYGGRGIAICAKWHESFEAFYADLGPRPSPKHTLDRINNTGPYEPGNCAWATRTQQNRNKRNIRQFTLNGVSRPLFEWAELHGFKTWKVLDTRLRRGWSVERALTQPAD